MVPVWQYAGIDSARLMLGGKTAESAPVLSSWRKVRRSVFIGIQCLYLRFVTLLRGLRCDLETCNETQFHAPAEALLRFRARHPLLPCFFKMIERLSLHRPVRQDFKILTQPERGERALRDPIKKQQRLIALFIDDAHNLHSKTLIGLKRLRPGLVTSNHDRPSFGAILSFIVPKGHLNHNIGENW